MSQITRSVAAQPGFEPRAACKAWTLSQACTCACLSVLSWKGLLYSSPSTGRGGNLQTDRDMLRKTERIAGWGSCLSRAEGQGEALGSKGEEVAEWKGLKLMRRGTHASVTPGQQGQVHRCIQCGRE